MYSVSQKIPPEDLWQFFQNGWEFFNQILRDYYAFLSTLEYEFLFKYLQLWRSYAILSMTTPVHIMCARRPPSAETHAGIFWHFSKQLGIFSPNFTHQLNVHMHATVQIFIELSQTSTKLCHIKRDHHNVLKMSTIDRGARARNARWVVALNVA